MVLMKKDTNVKDNNKNDENDASKSYFNGVYAKIIDDMQKNWSNIDRIGQVCSNYSLTNHLRLVQEIKQKGYEFKERFLILNPISVLNESQSNSLLNDKKFHDSLELSLKCMYVVNENIIQEFNKGLKQSEKINGTSTQLLLVILGNLANQMKLINDLLVNYQELITKKTSKISVNEVKPIITKFCDEKESNRILRRIEQVRIDASRKEGKAIKKKNRFFARTKDDISKAAVDFFSIGHILMGQIIFSIVYGLLVYVPEFNAWVGSPADPKLWAFIVAVLCGILWEPIENIILYKLGLKFESKRDSWLNLIFDTIFVTIGATLSYFINVWQINLLLVIIEIILFVIIASIFAR